MKKYFRDSTGGLHCLESEESPELLPAGSIEISKSDFDAQLSESELAGNSSVQRFHKIQAQAIEALQKSDITVLRCYEASAALPMAWVAYRQQLRTLVAAVDPIDGAHLPLRPPYP